MPEAIPFNSHFLLSKHPLFLNPAVETNSFLQSPNFATKVSLFQCFSLSHKTHVQKPIVCVKRMKKRSGFQRSTRFMIQLVSILACDLRILPQPLDLVIQEFNGGNGGGLGFMNDFAGGGFGWWRRRRRRRKGNLWFIVCLVIFGSLFLLFGRTLRSVVFCDVLSLGLFGIFLIKGLKKNVKNWIFGSCCLSALMCLWLRREKAMQWIDEFRSCAPMVAMVRRGKSRGRRSL